MERPRASCATFQMAIVTLVGGGVPAVAAGVKNRVINVKHVWKVNVEWVENRRKTYETLHTYSKH